MSDEDKIKRCKNIAAQKAFETYGKTLTELLTEAGLPFISSVDGTAHVHSAIMFDGAMNAVAVRCEWMFSAHPAIVAAGLELARKEGNA